MKSTTKPTCNGKLTKERLVRLRKEKGWSQEEAAKAIGTARTTWQQWELGVRLPNAPALLAIAYTFNVNYDYVCGLTDEIEPSVLLIPQSSLQDGDRHVIETYLKLTTAEKKLIQTILSFLMEHRKK